MTEFGDLLPTISVVNGEVIAATNQFPRGNEYPMFYGGETRINEVTTLTVIHTLFIREHNRIVDEVLRENGGSILCGSSITSEQIDEALYQYAKEESNAYQQKILYSPLHHYY